jgi:hypothetical protein
MDGGGGLISVQRSLYSPVIEVPLFSTTSLSGGNMEQQSGPNSNVDKAVCRLADLAVTTPQVSASMDSHVVPLSSLSQWHVVANVVPIEGREGSSSLNPNPIFHVASPLLPVSQPLKPTIPGGSLDSGSLLGPVNQPARVPTSFTCSFS